MDFSDPGWQNLVESFAGSLISLQKSASRIVPLSIETLEAPDGAAAVVESAEAHLQNSRLIDEYLSQRLDDPDARQVLGRVASVDFEAAGLLDAASEEPEFAMDAFREAAADLDVESVRSDLLGHGAIRGGQADPAPIEVVEGACDDALGNAGACARDLAGDLAAAVTLTEVLDGLAGIVGGAAATWIEELKKVVGVVKKKVLDLVNSALAKIAKLLRLDPEKIKKEITSLWDKAKERVEDWAADVLGRSKALEVWRNWLAEQPPPDNAQVQASLTIVEKSKEGHDNQLKWAGKAIWVYGKLASWGAMIRPAGPPVVVAVAAGLGGWVTWATWDFLDEVKESPG